MERFSVDTNQLEAPRRPHGGSLHRGGRRLLLEKLLLCASLSTVRSLSGFPGPPLPAGAAGPWECASGLCRLNRTSSRLQGSPLSQGSPVSGTLTVMIASNLEKGRTEESWALWAGPGLLGWEAGTHRDHGGKGQLNVLSAE